MRNIRKRDIEEIHSEECENINELNLGDLFMILYDINSEQNSPKETRREENVR